MEAAEALTISGAENDGDDEESKRNEIQARSLPGGLTKAATKLAAPLAL